MIVSGLQWIQCKWKQLLFGMLVLGHSAHAQLPWPPQIIQVTAEHYARQFSGAVAILRDPSFDRHTPVQPELWVNGKLSCTAFHVGGGVVITSGHCTSQNWKEITLEWDVVSRPEVNEGASRSVPPRLISKVIANLGRRVEPDVTDYQILLVSPVPPVKLPFSYYRPMIENEAVFSIGNPFGGPQVVSLPQHTYSVDSCDTGRSIVRAYRFPIQEGQSGSPLISLEDGMVVGVINSDTQATLLQCITDLKKDSVKRRLPRM